MKRIGLLISCLLFAFMAEAQNPQKLPIDPNVRYGKLENGLTYYVRHNAYPENRADFYIAQKVGSMQEEDSQAGLAHFLEHMAFNGTDNFPGRKNMLNYLETIGARFGANVNAYTSFDETVYNLSEIPTTREGIIDSCLLILHDWSGSLTLENDEIDKERLIIKEEWRTRGGAQQRTWEKQLPILFKDSKYANRLPIGSMDVVENFDYQVLKDYYHKWYRPDLQAIIVVGDIDADAVEKKIIERFSSIPMPDNAAEREYFTVPDNEEPLISVVSDVESTQSLVYLFCKHDVEADEIRLTDVGYVNDVLKNLSAMMIAGRLTEISQKADAPFAYAVAYDGQFFVAKTKDAWTSVAVSKEGREKESLATLVTENERLKRFGFVAPELERAKANLLSSVEKQYNNRNKHHNSSYVSEYVRSFSDNEPIPGIEFEFEFLQKVLPMISVKMINDYIKTLLPQDNSNIAIAISGPEKEGLIYPTEAEVDAVYKATVQRTDIEAYQEEIVDTNLIKELPKAGKVISETRNDKFDVTEWELSNGIKVYIKETDFQDDEVKMTSRAEGGVSLVSDEDVFNASYTVNVVGMGGLGDYSATDLKKALAGKNVHAYTYFAQNHVSVGGVSNVKDVKTMLQLAYLHFTAPRKDEEVFKVRTEFDKEQIRNRENNPKSALSDSLNHYMYPNNPRYKIIKEADIDRLDYDRIMEIYHQMLANPGSFKFFFVGNVDKEALKPLVEQYLASLPMGDKGVKHIEHDMSIQKGKQEHSFSKEMTDPKTTSYSLYHGHLDRNLKNDISMNALNQILDIVYTRTVREEEGGTYGVGVSAGIRRFPEGETMLQMYFDTNPDEVAKVTPIIERELVKIAKEGPEDVDFQKVKEHMLKSRDEELKRNGYWSEILEIYYYYGEDNHSDCTNIIQSLTKDDVKKIASDLLKQENSLKVTLMPEERAK